jgi:hypothetical protein
LTPHCLATFHRGLGVAGKYMASFIPPAGMSGLSFALRALRGAASGGLAAALPAANKAALVLIQSRRVDVAFIITCPFSNNKS